MAERSKAPESGPTCNLVRKGVSSNLTVIIAVLLYRFFFRMVSPYQHNTETWLDTYILSLSHQMISFLLFISSQLPCKHQNLFRDDHWESAERCLHREVVFTAPPSYTPKPLLASQERSPVSYDMETVSPLLEGTALFPAGHRVAASCLE